MTLDNIINKISTVNPIHGRKLKKNVSLLQSPHYTQFSKHCLEAYENKLMEKGWDYLIESYLKVVDDTCCEHIHFLRTGEYSNTSFEKVNQEVYANKNTMHYYMHGIFLSQLLWRQHYSMIKFFSDEIQSLINIQHYLEIGVGHGLYLSESIENFKEGTIFNVIDISESSTQMAKKLISPHPVNFIIQDIFNYQTEQQYDFIVMGEVLEHVEDPLKLLKKLCELITPSGTVFISAPTNAPMIDHIYLFHTADEIKDLIHQAGFSINKDINIVSEDLDETKAEETKIATLYGAFLKKVS